MTILPPVMSATVMLPLLAVRLMLTPGPDIVNGVPRAAISPVVDSTDNVPASAVIKPAPLMVPIEVN